MSKASPSARVSEPSMSAAILALAAAIDRHSDQTKPIADFFQGAGDRLDRLCQFLKARGALFLWVAPVVIVIVQSVSPNAAEALDAIFKALEAHRAGD